MMKEDNSAPAAAVAAPILKLCPMWPFSSTPATLQGSLDLSGESGSREGCA